MSYLSTLQGIAGSNLKAVWLCDDAAASGTMADSQGSHTGTTTGTVTQGDTPLLTDGGKAITFGGGYATASSSADWQVGTGDFAVVWWFKTTQATAIWLGGETGDLYTGIVSNKLTTSGIAGTIAGATTVNDNAVHLAVFARVSGTMNIYLDNGTLDGTGSYSTSNSISSALGIGAGFDGGFNALGTMDGAAWIKGQGLSQSDVQSIYAAGTAAAAQDTPELYGRPFGRQGQRQMQQLLSQ